MPSTRLFFSASVEEQWRDLTGPWLREQASAAWKSAQPTVILTPTRAEGFYLRSRLVDEKASFLGLRFWTPSDVRKFLLAELSPDIGSATQAELRLVARACAEKLARQAGKDNAVLNSVIREPSPFLRAYDLLLGAGWDPSRDGAVYGRELSYAVQQTLNECQIATQAGIHRQLRREISSREEPVIANLLVAGFNAAHWPLWDLLKAVVFSAEQAVVGLTDPRVFAEEIDQLWISSWEEVTQTEAISPVSSMPPDEEPSPFAGLVASYELGSSGNAPVPDLGFLVTPDLASHVRAIVLQALDYLQSEDCSRLGIVFAEANALALGVAEELRRFGIPLDDGTGLLTPGPFEKRCWQTWLALQEEPGVPSLIAWVRACEVQDVSCGVEPPLTARDIADTLDSALGESLVDDLNFLASHLEEDSSRKYAKAVADFLRRLVTLPESATFAEFLAIVREAVTLPGWDAYRARLEMDPPSWLLKNKESLSRRTFIEWLREATVSQARTRGADGNHFYGKVHLLIYAQVSGQTWSHLILTGLNEGVWPRAFEAGAFGSRHELAALNRQVRSLNQTGTGQGRQGMGHETVGTDRGHCLLPLERQDLALRDLCAALESTSAAACLTAMTTDAGRGLLPSDFFNHAYQAQTGCILDEETFRQLANTTEDWCREHQFLFASKSDGASSAIAATQIAYAARRDASQPFGPYEFAYAQPPHPPIQLSCKRWEDAWNHPATVWLEEVVGASSWPDGTLSWPRAIGTWVHRWLATSLREDAEKKAVPAELPVLLWAAADREKRNVGNHARAAGMNLYPWWEQVWSRARNVALGLAEMLAPHLADKTFLCEFRLPSDLMIALPATDRADFLLRGQIDFLLIEPGANHLDLTQNDFSGCACWVIDFKTGTAQSLSEKRIGEGRGLQTVLYALATRARGAASTAISLLVRDATLKKQVDLDDVLNTAPLFRSLDKFHRDGIFGMHANAANDYGFSPSYPMATQFVPKNILEAKWMLVHGTTPANAEDNE